MSRMNDGFDPDLRGVFIEQAAYLQEVAPVLGAAAWMLCVASSPDLLMYTSIVSSRTSPPEIRTRVASISSLASDCPKIEMITNPTQVRDEYDLQEWGLSLMQRAEEQRHGPNVIDAEDV